MSAPRRLVSLDDIPRERLERYAAGLAEYRRREERAKQSAPGGLMHFVRYFWSILEPNTPLIDGWVMQAVAEHLEAVSYGKINRLLINVPPGFSKSLLTNVFWPLWEWVAIGRPDYRYVCFSYGSHLTERDNRRMLDIIRSQRFQELWGHVFHLRKAGEVLISNDKMGWKLATSVGGIGTGERGNRILCFPGDELVQTEIGPLPIGHIVERQLALRVYSRNLKTGAVELRPITRWYRNPASRLVTVKLSNGHAFRCTPNHNVMVDGQGWRAAGDLSPGLRLAQIPVPRLCACDAAIRTASSNVVHDRLADRVFARKISCAFGRGKDGQDFGLTQRGAVSPRPIRWSQGDASGRILPHETQLYVPHHARRNAKSRPDLRQRSIGAKNGHSLLAGELSLRALVLRAKCAMPFGIRNVFSPRAVFKIVQPIVSSIAVSVANLRALRARAYKCFRHHLMTEAVQSLSVLAHGDARISLVKDWGQNATSNGKLALSTHSLAWNATDAAEARNLIQTFKSNDSAPDFVCVEGVEQSGHANVTYCLEVEINHNFAIGESCIQVRNCDDPHNVKEGESEAVRTETVRWFRESLSDRLNDMQTGAIIVIMQRVHDADVSGTILSEGMGYVHLNVPMEYDPSRHCRTVIGWSDPRTTDFEPAWPERFPPRTINDIKIAKGPYAYSGQYQQAPTPRGGGIIKREWWQLWEPADGLFPQCDFVLASVDTAYTEKEENDPSGFTIWGVFRDKSIAKLPTITTGLYGGGAPIDPLLLPPDLAQTKVILMHAWRKRLQLHGPNSWESKENPELRLARVTACKGDPQQEPWRSYVATGYQTIERWPRETEQQWVARTQSSWGLVEWVAHSCRRFKADLLLIEGKASGLSVAQEMARLYGHEKWQVQTTTPDGDKTARAHAVVSLFTQGLIYAPDREWAEMAIDEATSFPKGQFKDVTDSMTQALRFLRDNNILMRREDRDALEQDAYRQRPGSTTPLYPA